MTTTRLKHLGEVIQWIESGYELECEQFTETGMKWKSCVHPFPEQYYDNLVKEIMRGIRYRLKSTKIRRPFTVSRMQELVGCVLVSPDLSKKYVVVEVSNDVAIVIHCRQIYGLLATTLCDNKWLYHLPGESGNMKQCWTEE